mmetsp:Transcript_6148/g.18353  ORF Transcript_6148/g.18353 Transcript_6148/m.18353 type:complete len:215 (+) Transcript_6148:488-1132(+)
MVASFRMICAFACRMCPCFSLMRSSILASSACSETSDDAVAASSSASSFDRRRRSCRHVSSSLPIDSRSSCTYSRQRPSGLDAWQRVWIVVRSVVISFLLGSLTDEPVFAPFLPRMMPPSPSSSPIGSVPSSSPGCSISALACAPQRTTRQALASRARTRRTRLASARRTRSRVVGPTMQPRHAGGGRPAVLTTWLHCWMADCTVGWRTGGRVG